MATDTSKFNSNMDKLFDALSESYPTDPDIPYYRDKICLVRKMNSKIVAEQFVEIVAPFIDQVMGCDSKFFIDMDVSGLVEDNAYLKLIQKIKSLWESMTPTSQMQIWKYFQLFTTLGIKITRRTDLLPTLNKWRTTPLTI